MNHFADNSVGSGGGGSYDAGGGRSGSGGGRSDGAGGGNFNITEYVRQKQDEAAADTQNHLIQNQARINANAARLAVSRERSRQRLRQLEASFNENHNRLRRLRRLRQEQGRSDDSGGSNESTTEHAQQSQENVAAEYYQARINAMSARFAESERATQRARQHTDSTYAYIERLSRNNPLPQGQDPTVANSAASNVSGPVSDGRGSAVSHLAAPGGSDPSAPGGQQQATPSTLQQEASGIPNYHVRDGQQELAAPNTLSSISNAASKVRPSMPRSCTPAASFQGNTHALATPFAPSNQAFSIQAVHAYPTTQFPSSNQASLTPVDGESNDENLFEPEIPLPWMEWADSVQPDPFPPGSRLVPNPNDNNLYYLILD